MNLPDARTKNIVVQELDKELLIYDLLTNKALCLNETAKIVFEACDGQTSIEELKRRAKLPDEIIYFALDELRRENLLAENYQSKFAGVSRRDVIRRIGLATMTTLPVIAALTAPKAAQAQSANCAAFGQSCKDPGDSTQSNCCSGLRCARGGDCLACIPSGVGYAGGLICSSAAACQTDCDSVLSKNRCCNSGPSTNDFNGDGNTTCFCP